MRFPAGARRLPPARAGNLPARRAEVVEPEKGLLRAKVFLAANVYQQDELRGVKEVIRSFRVLTKSTPLFPSSVAGGTGVVEREKVVVITALFATHPALRTEVVERKKRVAITRLLPDKKSQGCASGAVSR